MEHIKKRTFSNNKSPISVSLITSIITIIVDVLTENEFQKEGISYSLGLAKGNFEEYRFNSLDDYEKNSSGICGITSAWIQMITISPNEHYISVFINLYNNNLDFNLSHKETVKEDTFLQIFESIANQISSAINK